MSLAEASERAPGSAGNAMGSRASEVGELEQFRSEQRRLIADACHDIRTPLAVIKEFASIMAEGMAGDINQEQEEFLGIILDRVDRLSVMVDELLAAGGRGLNAAKAAAAA